MSSGGGGGLPNQPMARPVGPMVGTTDVRPDQLAEVLNQPSNGASRFLDGPIQTGGLSITSNAPTGASGGGGFNQFGGQFGGLLGGLPIQEILNSINGRGAVGGAGGGRGFGSGNGLLGNQMYGSPASIPSLGGGQNLGGIDQEVVNPTYQPPDRQPIMGRFPGGF